MAKTGIDCFDLEMVGKKVHTENNALRPMDSEFEPSQACFTQIGRTGGSFLIKFQHWNTQNCQQKNLLHFECLFKSDLNDTLEFKSLFKMLHCLLNSSCQASD